jgi:hypothetical protein
VQRRLRAAGTGLRRWKRPLRRARGAGRRV